MRPKIVRILAVVFVLSLLTAACFSGDDDSVATTNGDLSGPGDTASPTTTIAAATTVAPTAETPSGEPDDAGEGRSGGSTAAQAIVASLQPSDLGRSIIFTASIDVEVEDVAAAGQQAQAALEPLGGILFGQETTTGDSPRSVLTFKVPPGEFREALARLAGLGDLVSQRVFADDVTDRVVDVQSRITTAAASVERLRQFLENATDLEQVARLEAQLLQRETDLEVLRGQLRTLENQVALATIVLVLTEPLPPVPEPAVEVVVTAYRGHDGGNGCPGADTLSIDEGEEMTVCYAFENVGDTGLDEPELTDAGLDIDPDEFIVVFGGADIPLAAGERIMYAAEVEVERGRFPAPSVRSTPVDPDGDPLREALAVEIENVELTIVPDESLPGFGDALSAGWGATQRVIGIAVVVVGAVIPFLWLGVLILVGVWVARRRSGSPNEASVGPGVAEEA